MNEKFLRFALKKMIAEGATQQEIADKAGLSQNCVCRFLHGSNDISFSRGLKLMKVVFENQNFTAPDPSVGKTSEENLANEEEAEDCARQREEVLTDENQKNSLTC